MGRQSDGTRDSGKPVTLKVLSEHLGLSKTTISMVLNNAPGAQTIAPATRQRVRDAAVRFQYRPNLHAQVLGARPRESGSEGELMDHREVSSVDRDQARRVRQL